VIRLVPQSRVGLNFSGFSIDLLHRQDDGNYRTEIVHLSDEASIDEAVAYAAKIAKKKGAAAAEVFEIKSSIRRVGTWPPRSAT
jgi:hypothetical protein